MAVTKAICNQKDFVTDIGDICTHVTAIADPWVGNGCHKGAHTKCSDIRRSDIGRSDQGRVWNYVA